MLYRNVCEQFLDSVRQHPDRTAIIFGNDRLSYFEANKRVNRIANALLSLGVNPGDKVAFLFANCIEIVLIYYAIQKIGAIAVPLNFRLIAREVELLVNNSDSKVLIFSQMFENEINETGLRENHILICEHKSEHFDCSLDELESKSSDSEPQLFQDENAVSRIQFTGGSTGTPKGVMRTHSQDLYEIDSEMKYTDLCNTQNAVILIQCPLEHHGGHSWFTAAMSCGATLIICSAYDPKKILEQIQNEKVTHTLLLPPTTYLRLCEYPDAFKYDTSSILLAQSAAGGTNKKITSKMEKLFPNARIFYGWGQTESGVGTYIVLNNPENESKTNEICSIGKPMPNIELKVVDDNWNEVPRGVLGEAVVKGPTVMKGYYAHPELTEKIMGEDGWLRTGDMMYQDADGYFFMLSRKKNVIKSGGENVFSDDVERVIRLHEDIIDCVVVGVPDERLGETILAVVQLAEGKTMTLEQLQNHCKQYLSSYKKPMHIEVVSELDRDDAGKIRKDELRDRYIEKYLNLNKGV